MGQKLVVVIIGLPLFAKRLATQLSNFYPNGKFIALDTYYSKIDKLKSLWWIRRASVVFSINGSLETSKIFDYTLKLGKPLIMNWVGTDVQLAQKFVKNGTYRKNYIEKAIHLCEVTWIQEELTEIGIEATICNFASFDKSFVLSENFTNELAVLNYIPEDRKQFYGMDIYIQLAKSNPAIHFYIAGSQAKEYQDLPKNVFPLGWVKNMDALYDKIQVCIRIPEHDGLSTFVLEGLARGKQVIYKYAYPHVMNCSEFSDINMQLKEFEKQWLSKQSLINTEGADFVRNKFNSNIILGNLINLFQDLNTKNNATK